MISNLYGIVLTQMDGTQVEKLKTALSKSIGKILMNLSNKFSNNLVKRGLKASSVQRKKFLKRIMFKLNHR
jgi:hypothetical protein